VRGCSAHSDSRLIDEYLIFFFIFFFNNLYSLNMIRLYLSLTSIVHFVSAATVDVCQSLCHEFSAARRGEGYDLCDAPSFCRDNFCTNLFWSHTEDGVHGLIYSNTTADLSRDERTSPVTCHQASQLIPSSRNEFTFSEHINTMNSLQTALEVFLRLPIVAATLQANVNETSPVAIDIPLTLVADFRDHLETVDQVNGTLVPRSTGLMRALLDLMSDDDGPIAMVRHLLEHMGLSLISMGRQLRMIRRCTGGCGQETEFLQIDDLLVRTIPMNMVTLDLQTLVNEGREESWNCESCGIRSPHLVERRLFARPQILLIDLQRYYIRSDYMMTSIRVPLRLAIGEYAFRLNAVIHRESIYGDYFANFYHNGQWWEYKDYRLVPVADLVDNALSSTATAFFYSPVM
jgi:hypothetical protein